MPETTVAENKSSKIASMGAPERVGTTIINPEEKSVPEGQAATDDTKGAATDTKREDKLTVKILDEDSIKEWFKSQGMEYEGADKLKEKLTAKQPPVQTELTEEQKAEQFKAKEKKRLDKWIEGKGTIETYVGIKNIADADVKQLSIDTARKELKDLKFSDEEIDKAIKARYFQFDDDEIEQEENETDKAFKKRLKEYGAAKLANRSTHTQKQAQDILAKLDKEIESEDLDAQEEQTISANIDEKFKSVNLKDTYEIGEINGKAILPIESEVSEADITEVREMLKNPDKRNNILFNKDGSLNYGNIADVLIENKKLKSALKVSYHEGSTRTNEHWQKVFPNESAYAIGVGGSSAHKINGNGKVASFGKSEKTKLSTT